MTRIFKDDGSVVPVTVIQVARNVVSQVKTLEKDGYSAIQVASGSLKSSQVAKPMAGHFAKAGVEAGDRLVEFRLEDGAQFNVGDALTVDRFQEGQSVDVSGVSKVKVSQVLLSAGTLLHNATHGNSLSHRAPGSIGQNQSPGPECSRARKWLAKWV